MTGSTYLNFDKANKTGLDLIRSGKDANFGLLIVVGVNLGLRIGDLLSLTFEDLKEDKITLNEGKTGKSRTLNINDNIKTALKYFEEDLRYRFGGIPFVSQKGSVYSRQQVNRKLKQYFKGVRISSHSLRKSFGRRVWENNGETEKALIYLSDIFGHSSVEITRTYLGIKAEEIENIYLNL